jgi:hypothetical protein
MYMLLPTDEAGKRKYIHVGVDSDKQQQAIAKVSRYEERETVRRQIRLLHELYDQCHLQLSAMLNQLRCDINQVTGNTVRIHPDMDIFTLSCFIGRQEHIHNIGSVSFIVDTC